LIRNGHTSRSGGGLNLEGSTSVLTIVTFTGNVARDGGAVYVYEGAGTSILTTKGCGFSGNDGGTSNDIERYTGTVLGIEGCPDGFDEIKGEELANFPTDLIGYSYTCSRQK